MNNMKYLKTVLCCAISVVCGSSLAQTTMTPLTDEQMSATSGQALFNMSYLAPGDTTNYASNNTVGNQVGFYRLGVEGTVEINANIRKLQLGCGGVNGAGGCDIDIDNLALSGNPGVGDCAAGAARPSCDAKLTNPYLELAIKNPNSASTRQVVGLRLGSALAQGLLTAGLENTGVANGINSISGFLRVQSDSTGYIYGKANTGARYLDARANAPYTINGVATTLNNEITGKIDSGVGAILSIKTIGGGLQIPAMTGIPFIRPGLVINQSRTSSLSLMANLAVPPILTDWRGANQTVNPAYPPNGQVIYHNPVETPIDWTFAVPKQVQTQGGPLSAQITNCSGGGCFLATIAGVNVGDVLQNAFIRSQITGISVDVTINEGLGFIHSLPINSPMYLSLQEYDLRWPGTYSGANPENTSQTVTDIAKRGWWLSMSDPVNLGSLDPTQNIDIAPLFPQIASKFSDYLNANPAGLPFTSLVNAIFGTGDINVDGGPVNLSAAPLSLTLSNIQLNGQSISPNCYGGLKFC